MKSSFKFTFLFLFFCTIANAQDTLKIKRPNNYDANCVLEVCVKNECFVHSISKKMFFSQNNIELRINGACTVKKKSDVFVSSFEISIGENDNIQVASAQSSFFNNFQKKIIQQQNPGESFIIKNIVVHGPDGFRKMEDMKIKLN